MVRTGYTYDRRFLLHDTGFDAIRLPSGRMLDPEPHPSSVRIVRRTAQLVAYSGLINELRTIPARSATEEELERVHDGAYVAKVRAVADAGRPLFPGGVPMTSGSWDAAVLAAGTAATLVDAVMAGMVTQAFGLIRPAGHHAARARTDGYSIFNNVAVAAMHAKEVHDVERVAIVDWDVHHGDGTQTIFWDDPDVLTISVHQDRWYPSARGTLEETGGDAAPGRSVNLPLPSGTGDGGYVLAVERVVVPVLRAFRPELILVSAGQDANFVDPLGRMLMTTRGFRAIASLIGEAAGELCEGRLIALHEGGYSAGYAPFCVLAVLEGLVGVRTEVEDPFLSGDRTHPLDLRRPEQAEAVEAGRRAAERFWPLEPESDR